MTVTRVTEEMVTRAIHALVYTGYNDETQRKIIKRQASCREYVRAALEAAFSLERETASEHSAGDDITLPNNPKPNPGGGG